MMGKFLPAALNGATLGAVAGILLAGGFQRAEAAQLCPSVATQTVTKFRTVCDVFDGSVCVASHTEPYQLEVSFPNIQLQNGACTNNGVGNPDPAAFSGAALASQALSELSQSSTQETARSAENTIASRREQEEQRCAEGFSRVNGVCERNPPPVAEAAPPPPPPAPAPVKPRAAKKAKKAKAAVAEVEAPAPRKVVYAPKVSPPSPPPPPPVPVEAPFRYGVWGQVFGEYEKREASGLANISGPDFNGGVPVPVNTDVQSQTGTVGFQAGLDYTARGLFAPGDGAIVGVLVGFLSSNLTLNTQSFSSNFSVVGNGFTHLTAQLTGPTLGAYATYFSGPFSADILAKFDILSLNQSFTDNLAFAGPNGPFANTFSDGGSTSVLNSTVAGNLNYRFNLYPNFWVEPTVGAQFTALGYGGGAAALGLENGNQVMVQGGARVGTTSVINNVLITATLTGLAYDDVAVNGGFIPGAAFAGNNILANADQGQVRGRGILALNFDFGQGLTSFVLGDVHGGTGLFGAGGKAGIRYQW
jgi:hypothetical protein